jgi:hypothetical protein
MMTAGYPKYVLSEERVGINRWVGICAGADDGGGGGGDDDDDGGDESEDEFWTVRVPSVSDEVDDWDDCEPTSDERSGRYRRSNGSYSGLGVGRSPPYSKIYNKPRLKFIDTSPSRVFKTKHLLVKMMGPDMSVVQTGSGKTLVPAPAVAAIVFTAIILAYSNNNKHVEEYPTHLKIFHSPLYVQE